MNKLKIDAADMRRIAPTLCAGQSILLSGRIYTARDAAHARLLELLRAGKPLPFELEGASIYYAGPTEAPAGLPIGSCGPTTASRMDSFSPTLLDNGLCCMIGKGERNAAVAEAMQRNGAVYLCAIGGAGALAAKCITACKVIAFDELGCESVKELYVRDFPLIVGMDCHGGSLFCHN